VATTTARSVRRAREREEARNARKTAAKNGAAKVDPDALAAAAAAGGHDEAVIQAAAAAGIPPLTMEEIPPEAQKALGDLLASTEGPKAAGGPTGASDAKESSKRARKYISLERELAELLTFPAGPALMAGDQFCAQHFAVQGPMLARQLVIYSESHAATYDTLVWLARQGSLLVIATAVVGYLLPPAIHHGLPAPSGLRQHYGMEQKPTEPDLAVAA